MSNSSLEHAEQLTQEAFAALEAGHYERVTELTAQLRELKFSSVFEIEALFHLDLNRPAQALQVLDEGTELVPDLWLLWQLKGNVLSDLKRYDDALAAYDRALDLEGADANSLRLNRATALWRDGRVKAALREVESTGIEGADLDLRWRLEALRLGLWAELQRCDEVRARAAALFAEQEDLEVEPEEAGPLSVAFSQIGWALMGCDQTEAAGRWAEAALEVDRTNGQALLLKRDTTPNLPLADKTFRVLVRGEDESGGEENQGFVTPIFVVASDKDGAQTLALNFESRYHRGPLKVEEVERTGVCERQPSCVYEVQGYIFFPGDADEQ